MDSARRKIGRSCLNEYIRKYLFEKDVFTNVNADYSRANEALLERIVYRKTVIFGYATTGLHVPNTISWTRVTSYCSNTRTAPTPDDPIPRIRRIRYRIILITSVKIIIIYYCTGEPGTKKRNARRSKRMLKVGAEIQRP